MMRTALQKDSDLGNLCQEKPCRIFQTLFICIECDHVSYFKSMGKATILNVFFQYALFICGENMPGCLDSTSLHIREQGFLSFIRLIGTCYLKKKHLTAFIALEGHTTPMHSSSLL